jgi:hypothetical protein
MKGGATTRARRARVGSRLLVALALTVGVIVLPASGQAAAPSVPSVTTGSVSNVTLYGYVDGHGQLTNYVFQYGTSSAYGAQSPLAPAGNGTIMINVSQVVAGLRPGVTYHYRVVAISPGGTTKGALGGDVMRR